MRGDQFLAALPSAAAPGSSTKQPSFGLSRSLAWIQETNFEDKFEVVKVIGYVRVWGSPPLTTAPQLLRGSSGFKVSRPLSPQSKRDVCF